MQVKVWNLNEYKDSEFPNGVTYQEEFRGRDIVIPPGKFVMMEQSEAEEFFGTYVPPLKSETHGGVHPRSWKKLKLEYPPKGRDFEPEKFICPRTGERFETQEAYDKHLAQFKDLVVTDKETEDQLKKELEAKARALGMTVSEKKKPGPKPGTTKGSSIYDKQNATA